jgi:hypothetical protein
VHGLGVDVAAKATVQHEESSRLDRGAYRRQLTRLRAQRAEAAENVEGINEDLNDAWRVSALRTLKLARTVKETWLSRSDAEKRAPLDISNPTLTGRKVSFELKKTFALLAEMRLSGVGRAP